MRGAANSKRGPNTQEGLEKKPCEKPNHRSHMAGAAPATRRRPDNSGARAASNFRPAGAALALPQRTGLPGRGGPRAWGRYCRQLALAPLLCSPRRARDWHRALILPGWRCSRNAPVRPRARLVQACCGGLFDGKNSLPHSIRPSDVFESRRRTCLRSRRGSFLFAVCLRRSRPNSRPCTAV